MLCGVTQSEEDDWNIQEKPRSRVSHKVQLVGGICACACTQMCPCQFQLNLQFRLNVCARMRVCVLYSHWTRRMTLTSNTPAAFCPVHTYSPASCGATRGISRTPSRITWFAGSAAPRRVHVMRGGGNPAANERAGF